VPTCRLQGTHRLAGSVQIALVFNWVGRELCALNPSKALRDVLARLTFDNEIVIYISNAALNFREAREGEFYASLIKGVN
jgi:hypothetical protein